MKKKQTKAVVSTESKAVVSELYIGKIFRNSYRNDKNPYDKVGDIIFNQDINFDILIKAGGRMKIRPNKRRNENDAIYQVTMSVPTDIALEYITSQKARKEAITQEELF